MTNDAWKAQPKVFIDDRCEEPERVHATVAVTAELCADERAFNAFVGLQLREMLLAGKTVVVKVPR